MPSLSLKKVFRGVLCIAVFLLALFFMLYFGLRMLLFPVTHDVWDAQRQVARLADAPDLRDVAAACLTLLQSAPPGSTTSFHLDGSDERVPAAIRAKHPHQVYVSPGSQMVEIPFGGGFFHYGYRFEPADSAAGHWKLLLYGEEEDQVKELLIL